MEARARGGYLLAFLFCFACVGVSYYVTQRQQRLYRATATIQILPPSVLGSNDALFTPAIVNDETYLATQLAILTTPETIIRAVKESGLDRSPDFQGKGEQEIAKMAFGRIECARRRGLYLVDVSVVGPEPRVLDDLCNAVVKSFQTMQKSEAKRLRDDRRESIEATIQTTDSQISLLQIDKTRELQGANFAETTLEAEYARIQESRKRLVEKDDELYADLMEMEPVVNALKTARQDPAKWAAEIAHLPFIASDPKVKEADERIFQLRDEREAKSRGGVGAGDERIRAIDLQIELASKARVRVIEGLAGSFILGFEEKAKKHESLRRQIELKTQELSSAARVKQKVDEKNAEIARNMVNKDAAIREREILDRHAVEEKDAVKIESNASEPTAPYSPNTATNLTIGLLVGGLPLAFLILRRVAEALLPGRPS